MDLEQKLEAMRLQMQREMEEKLAKMRRQLGQESEQTVMQEEILADGSKLPCFCLPGTSKLQKYKKRSNTSNMDGELFEVYVTMYLFIKGMFETNGFYLATNLDNAGAFDDIVFKFKDKKTNEERICFLQLKYKARRAITYKTLCAPSGDFSLLKYYSSFCAVRKAFNSCSDDIIFGDNFDKCQFIIYTNTDMDSSSGSRAEYGGSLLNILSCSDLEEQMFVFKSSKAELNSFTKLENYKETLQEIVNENIPVDKIEDKLKNFKQLDHCKYLLEALRKDSDFDELLNEQLIEVGNRNLWECFMNKLKIFTNQASDKDLEAVIQQNIEVYCGTTPLVSQDIIAKLKNSLIEWWRKENYILSENCAPFWDSIMESRISDLVHPMSTKLSVVAELRFNNVDDIESKINAVNVLHILTGGSTLLSCLKIQQCLSNVGHIMLDNKTFQNNQKEILTFWKRAKCCRYLVVESSVFSNDMLIEIVDILRSNVWKRFIVVSGSIDHSIRELCEEFQSEIYTDVFRLDQLSTESLSKVLKLQVNFQGAPLFLESLLGQDDVGLQDMLTADVLVQLLKNKKFEVGKELPKEEFCYIPRTLLRSECVNEDILSVKGAFRVAISGSNAEELQDLIVPGDTIQDFDFFLKYENYCECRYFNISSAGEFRRLSNMYNNIHWLHKEGDHYFWKESKGDIKLVRNYVMHDERCTEYDDIEHVTELSEKVVLIVAEPGMGKSTELLHLAKKLREKDESAWVIWLNLNDHSEYLNQNDPTAFELLCRAGKLDTVFQKSVFEHALYKKGNVTILLDGFDEISPKYAEKGIAIIKTLKTTKCEKLWVSSRHIMKNKLESELSVLAFMMKPFSREDQIRFLLNYWKEENIGPHDLNNFIAPLLKLVEYSLSGRATEFTGVPLIMKMLAEIYLPMALQCTWNGEYRLPKRLDLLNFFEDFIDRKWEIYCERNGINIAKGGVFNDYEDLKNLFQQNHVMSALLSLLPESEIHLHVGKDVEERIKPFLTKIENGNERTGIIREILDGKPIFTHKLFSEYFVALWFSSDFIEKRKYLETKLFEPDFQIVRNFFDRLLCKRCDLHVAVLNQDKDQVEHLCKQGIDTNLRDKGGRTALHLAIMNNINSEGYFKGLLKIIQILVDHGINSGLVDDILSLSPLQLAIKIRAWPIVDILLKTDTKSEDLIEIKDNIDDKDYIEDILRTATREGLANLVEYVLQCGIHVDHKISVGYMKLSRSATLLHEAARNRHVDLVRLLVNHGADIEARDSHFSRTPLLWGAPDLQTVKFLIQKGANPLVRDSFGKNAIMRAAKYGRLNVVRELSGVSDMTVCDKYRNNLLHFSIQGGNIDLVKYLVDIGMKTDSCNKDSETPLHEAAARKRWHILEYLLSCSNLAACDKFGNNILHICTNAGNADIVRIILNKGCDVNYCNKKYETALYCAARLGHLKIVEVLLEHNADLNIANYIGYTPLHIATRWDKLEIVQCLIQHGASLDTESKYGYTPLQLAVNHNSLNVIEFFEQIKQN
ncbi:uncharacterized protein [Periplaneta americana]|uniref:uncharacterized protein n=1 Tax=Periplaneta americana TaxID=6978 RepID=UPI0037E8D887